MNKIWSCKGQTWLVGHGRRFTNGSLTRRQQQQETASESGQQPEVAASSDSKNDYVNKLKKSSDLLQTKLIDTPWLTRHLAFQRPPVYSVYMYHNNRRMNDLKLEMLQDKSITSLLAHVDSNLTSLTIKEKAYLFKVFSLLNPTAIGTDRKKSDQELRQYVDSVIGKLEKDYYASSMKECHDLVDYMNYVSAFSVYRSSQTSNLHFHSFSTDFIFERIVKLIRKTNLAEEEAKQNDLAAEQSEDVIKRGLDEINRDWLLNDRLRLSNAAQLACQLPLLNRNGLSVFFHVMIRENYDRLIQIDAEKNRDEQILNLGMLLTYYYRFRRLYSLNSTVRLQYQDLFRTHMFALVENINKFEWDVSKQCLLEWFCQSKPLNHATRSATSTTTTSNTTPPSATSTDSNQVINREAGKFNLLSIVDTVGSRLNPSLATPAQIQHLKYRQELFKFFENNLKGNQDEQGERVFKMNSHELREHLVCVNLLERSLNEPLAPKSFQSSFYHLFDPVYSKFITGLSSLKLPDEEELAIREQSGLAFKRREQARYRLDKRFVNNNILTEEGLSDHKNFLSLLHVLPGLSKYPQLLPAYFSLLNKHNYESEFETSDFKGNLKHLIDLFINIPVSPGSHMFDTRINVYKHIYNTFVSNYNNQTETIDDMNLRLNAVCLLLNNAQYGLSKFGQLERIITDYMTHESYSKAISFEMISKLVAPLASNYDAYMENRRDEVIRLFKTIYDSLAKKLTNETHTRTSGLEDYNSMGTLTRDLFSLNFPHFDNKNIDLTQFKADFNRLLAEFENQSTFDPLASDLEKLKSLKMRITDLQRRIYIFALNLRYLSRLVVLSDTYNKELLFDITHISARISTLLIDNLFVTVLNAPDRFEYANLDNLNSLAMFNKSIILDLCSAYGLFNYFDNKVLLKDLSKSGAFKQLLKRMREVNEKVFVNLNETYKQKHQSELFEYWFNLLNMEADFPAINQDFMLRVKRFVMTNDLDLDHMKSKYGDNDTKKMNLLGKILHTMNQKLCTKQPSTDWLFSDYKPNYKPSAKADKVSKLLSSMIGPKFLTPNPVYKYNFQADYEIALDDANNFVASDSNKIKYRIPIIIVDKSYSYDNISEFKKPVALYLENFEKFYPVMKLNADTLLKMDTKREQIEYVKKRLVKSLENYFRNSTSTSTTTATTTTPGPTSST